MQLELMRDHSAVFPAITNPGSYVRAKIWHCSYKSLQDIGRLVNLTDLEIATLPDDSLDFLASLPRLEYLRVLHLPKIKNLSGISKLQSLKELSLETLPSWDASNKKTVVDSLSPLATLKLLEKITLYRVVPLDHDYSLLSSCLALQELNVQHIDRESLESLRKLHKVKPDLTGSFLKRIQNDTIRR